MVNRSDKNSGDQSHMTELAAINLRAHRDYSGSFSSAIPLQRSYGATSNQVSFANTKLLSHKVVRGDTLQGLSIKYGVPLENIRRLNKLWTNDSIFLKESLLIPVPQSRPVFKSDREDDDDASSGGIASPSYEQGSSLSGSYEVLGDVDIESQHEADTVFEETEKQEVEDISETETKNNVEEEEKSCSDFLKALDNRISDCKSKVLKFREQETSQPSVPEVAYDSYHAGKSSPTKHYSKFLEDI